MPLPALVTGGDLNFQNLSTVQTSNQPVPPTIASAATIAPTTFLTKISGTTALSVITPPVTGVHMLCFLFTAGTPVANGTSGNIGTAKTATQNVPMFFVYDPVTAKYY